MTGKASTHTFKSRIAQIFTPETLDAFDAIHDDGPTENVSQDEDMQLLQGRARLGGEADQLGPLLQHLTFGNVIVE